MQSRQNTKLFLLFFCVKHFSAFLFATLTNLLYLCSVIELGRHIEILLLDNDCVIVPEFGGFVAHHVSAHYEEDSQTWLPPMRTLGFNPQLRINDSLLVQSYVNAYDISYPEALHRIEDEVEELKQQLSSKGFYTLDNIGALSINTEGNYVFEPCEAGILTPEVYGLGCCDFLTLKQAKNVSIKPAAIRSDVDSKVENKQQAELEGKTENTPELLEFTDDGETDEKDEHIIRIKTSWIRNTVAIAAAIIAFFVMATPIANSDFRTRTMSKLQNNLIYKLIPQDTNMAPATPVVDSVPASTAAVKTTPKVAEPVTPKAVVTTPTYCIVLASHVKQSNAEEYVEKLKKQGYDEAEIYIHNKVVRVVFGSYENEGEAYRQLNKLNAKDKEFSEAWVYKKKSEA